MKPCDLLLKMNRINVSFVNTQCYDSSGLSNSENFSSESTDPLQGLCVEAVQLKCCKIDQVVFAEPLMNIQHENTPKDNPEDHDIATQEEITFIDNVMVQSKTGKKYKKYHISIEDPYSLTCPQSNCARSFSSTKLMKAHIRKVHCADRNKYLCEQCGRGFSAQYLLDRHAMVHEQKKVECPVCGTMLSGRTNLKSHLRCHSDLRPHQCALCSKGFSRLSTLATHVKFVHRERPLECHQCEVRFSSRKQWSEHITSHRSKKMDTSTSEET